MSDVIQIAKSRRARLMEEIEERMAEVEKLDEFIKFGFSLAREEGTFLARIAAE